MTSKKGINKQIKGRVIVFLLFSFIILVSLSLYLFTSFKNKQITASKAVGSRYSNLLLNSNTNKGILNSLSFSSDNISWNKKGEVVRQSDTKVDNKSAGKIEIKTTGEGITKQIYPPANVPLLLTASIRIEKGTVEVSLSPEIKTDISPETVEDNNPTGWQEVSLLMPAVSSTNKALDISFIAKEDNTVFYLDNNISFHELNMTEGNIPDDPPKIITPTPVMDEGGNFINQSAGTGNTLQKNTLKMDSISLSSFSSPLDNNLSSQITDSFDIVYQDIPIKVAIATQVIAEHCDTKEPGLPTTIDSKTGYCPFVQWLFLRDATRMQKNFEGTGKTFYFYANQTVKTGGNQEKQQLIKVRLANIKAETFEEFQKTIQIYDLTHLFYKPWDQSVNVGCSVEKGGQYLPSYQCDHKLNPNILDIFILYVDFTGGKNGTADSSGGNSSGDTVRYTAPGKINGIDYWKEPHGGGYTSYYALTHETCHLFGLPHANLVYKENNHHLLNFPYPWIYNGDLGQDTTNASREWALSLARAAKYPITQTETPAWSWVPKIVKLDLKEPDGQAITGGTFSIYGTQQDWGTHLEVGVKEIGNGTFSENKIFLPARNNLLNKHTLLLLEVKDSNDNIYYTFVSVMEANILYLSGHKEEATLAKVAQSPSVLEALLEPDTKDLVIGKYNVVLKDAVSNNIIDGFTIDRIVNHDTYKIAASANTENNILFKAVALSKSVNIGNTKEKDLAFVPVGTAQLLSCKGTSLKEKNSGYPVCQAKFEKFQSSATYKFTADKSVNISGNIKLEKNLNPKAVYIGLEALSGYFNQSIIYNPDTDNYPFSFYGLIPGEKYRVSAYFIPQDSNKFKDNQLGIVVSSCNGKTITDDRTFECEIVPPGKVDFKLVYYAKGINLCNQFNTSTDNSMKCYNAQWRGGYGCSWCSDCIKCDWAGSDCNKICQPGIITGKITAVGNVDTSKYIKISYCSTVGADKQFGCAFDDASTAVIKSLKDIKTTPVTYSLPVPAGRRGVEMWWNYCNSQDNSSCTNTDPYNLPKRVLNCKPGNRGDTTEGHGMPYSDNPKEDKWASCIINIKSGQTINLDYEIGDGGGNVTNIAPTPTIPPDAYHVFLTSETHDGNLGGRAGGDAICQRLAKKAGLKGTFKAWLSDDNFDAKDILVDNKPYYTTDGRLVANNKSELLNDGVKNYISADETGRLIVSSENEPDVYTGTYNSGKASPYICDNNWSAASGRTIASGIYSKGYNLYLWSAQYVMSCDTKLHLYCFQTDDNQPVNPQPTAAPGVNGLGKGVTCTLGDQKHTVVPAGFCASTTFCNTTGILDKRGKGIGGDYCPSDT